MQLARAFRLLSIRHLLSQKGQAQDGPVSYPSDSDKTRLVMVGDHDKCDASLARTVREKIPDSKLVLLPSSGHLVFEDQPKMWIESVRDFIDRYLVGQAPAQQGGVRRISNITRTIN